MVAFPNHTGWGNKTNILFSAFWYYCWSSSTRAWNLNPIDSSADRATNWEVGHANVDYCGTFSTTTPRDRINSCASKLRFSTLTWVVWCWSSGRCWGRSSRCRRWSGWLGGSSCVGATVTANAGVIYMNQDTLGYYWTTIITTEESN